MSYQSRQFKQLQRIWYEKLKKEGFEDIEDTSKTDRPLEAWHSFRFQRMPRIQMESAQIYYYRARQLLNGYQFINETQRIIWELHCDGYSKRQIAEKIRGFEKSYKRESIGLIIKRISKECK